MDCKHKNQTMVNMGIQDSKLLYGADVHNICNDCGVSILYINGDYVIIVSAHNNMPVRIFPEVKQVKKSKMLFFLNDQR